MILTPVRLISNAGKKKSPFSLIYICMYVCMYVCMYMYLTYEPFWPYPHSYVYQQGFQQLLYANSSNTLANSLYSS